MKAKEIRELRDWARKFASVQVKAMLRDSAPGWEARAQEERNEYRLASEAAARQEISDKI